MGNIAQWGTLMQRRRVSEVFRYVNSIGRKKMTVLRTKAPANYVPAAAVIRRGQALSRLLGVKERRRSGKSDVKTGAQPRDCIRNCQSRVPEVAEF